jgi:hypothetical protein
VAMTLPSSTELEVETTISPSLRSIPCGHACLRARGSPTTRWKSCKPTFPAAFSRLSPRRRALESRASPSRTERTRT